MKNRKLMVIFPLLLVLYEMTTYLSNDMYLPAMPFLGQDFGVARHAIQYTLSAWFLGSASLQLFLGPLSDRYGRKPVLLIGGTCFVLANLLSALTHDFGVFLLARYFQGAAVCSVVVAGYAAIHEFFDHIKAIKILAFMNSFTILAPAFGPIVGATLLTVIGWRSIFWLLMVWALLTLIPLFFIMPETNSNRGSANPLNFKTTIKNYVKIFTNKSFMVNTLSFCLVFAGLIAWVAAGSFLVISDFHCSAIYYGIIQAAIFGSFVIATYFLRFFAEKLELRNIIVIGYFFVLVSSMAMFLITFVWPAELMLFVVTLMGYAFAVGLLFSTVQRMAVESCKEPMGLVIASYFTFMGVFCILGSLLVALFFGKTVFSLAAIISVLGILSVFIRAFLLSKKVICYNINQV